LQSVATLAVVFGEPPLALGVAPAAKTAMAATAAIANAATALFLRALPMCSSL
jgi:hypothetical protein